VNLLIKVPVNVIGSPDVNPAPPKANLIEFSFRIDTIDTWDAIPLIGLTTPILSPGERLDTILIGRLVTLE
jgi:hypothetical protein